jgi:hypothetical protein
MLDHNPLHGEPGGGEMIKKILFLTFALCLLANSAHAVIVGRSGPPSGGASYPDYTSSNNCRGAWLFADNLNDSSGEGNNLTAGDASSYSTDRPNSLTTGKSMDLDGSNDYFYVPEATLDTNGNFPGAATSEEDFSFCIWVKRDTIGSGTYDDIFEIYAYRDAGWQGFWIQFTYGDSWDDPECKVCDTDEQCDNKWPTDTLNNNNWHHICFSFDGSATQGTWYIDNGSAQTDTYTNINNVGDAEQDFNIGGTGDYIDGHIYQPIIFDATFETIRTEMGDSSVADMIDNIYNHGIDGNG